MESGYGANMGIGAGSTMGGRLTRPAPSGRAVAARISTAGMRKWSVNMDPMWNREIAKVIKILGNDQIKIGISYISRERFEYYQYLLAGLSKGYPLDMLMMEAEYGPYVEPIL
jgi:hypothetical protein